MKRRNHCIVTLAVCWVAGLSCGDSSFAQSSDRGCWLRGQTGVVGAGLLADLLLAKGLRLGFEFSRPGRARCWHQRSTPR